jgi:hypothetical protein
MTDKVTLSDGTTVEPTTADSIHTAVGGLLTAAEAASDQLTEEQSAEEQSRQDKWVNYLKGAVLGPRDFTDPEGTIQLTESQTPNYLEAFGQTSPNANTEKNERVVERFFDGSFEEMGQNSIDPQSALYQPQLTSGEVIPVVPDDLATAKKMLQQYVCRVHPVAEYWFAYMEGDENALPASKHMDEGNSGSSDDHDRSEWCDGVAALEDVDGVGPAVIENIREYVASGNSITLDEETVNRELGILDQYEDQGAYLNDNSWEDVRTLREEQPEVWEELGS